MSPDEKPEEAKGSGFSFQDMMADMGELPTAVEKKAPLVPLNRNRVEPAPDSPRPGAPKAIYDRPRPIDAPAPKSATPAAKGGMGQPAAIFFDDERRKVILDEQDEAVRKQELIDRINSRVLGDTSYKSKPIWNIALLFAAITAAFLYLYTSSDEYRQLYDPYFSVSILFFAGITIFISASGLLTEDTSTRKVLCLPSLGIGAAVCYFVYPNLHF